MEPGLIEQSLGEWQGLPHHELPEKLVHPAHAFWPLAGTEKPPGGESMPRSSRVSVWPWSGWRTSMPGATW